MAKSFRDSFFRSTKQVEPEEEEEEGAECTDLEGGEKPAMEAPTSARSCSGCSASSSWRPLASAIYWRASAPSPPRRRRKARGSSPLAVPPRWLLPSPCWPDSSSGAATAVARRPSDNLVFLHFSTGVILGQENNILFFPLHNSC
ncbi:hypothetical protein BRADI_2g61922v3 [Brachypodium distachyon]|uniref:Uncharacterized protein n=1 Tax=Brachypodium distachyon TaxID=15368 RepID=A0A2K2DHB1_BRADI|nr:hypothetical protein BRADI_2g61922v3 [Brachypodium distachyon]